MIIQFTFIFIVDSFLRFYQVFDGFIIIERKFNNSVRCESMLVKLNHSSDLGLVLKYSGSVRGRTASD